MTKLQQHDMRLEEQKNLLRGKVEKEVSEFSSKMDGFKSKWTALKPKGTPEGDPASILVGIDDKMRELEELKKEADVVRRNCENFGIDPPAFPVLAAVDADLVATKEAWARFEEFSAERTKMGDTDWLSFKGRVYELEDFMAKWSDRVRTSAAGDAVKMVIVSELERLRRVLPVLKFVGGDTYEAKHWAELLSMLGLPLDGPRKVDRATLKVGAGVGVRVWGGGLWGCVMQGEHYVHACLRGRGIRGGTFFGGLGLFTSHVTDKLCLPPPYPPHHLPSVL